MKHPILINRRGEIYKRDPNRISFISISPLNHYDIVKALWAASKEREQVQLAMNLCKGLDENGLIVWAEGSNWK